LVGASTFSEPDVMSELPLDGCDETPVRYLGDLEDDAVARLMSNTDVLVVPSYHEGYCLPVIEAYQAGCQVVAYDAGNLPNVVGHLGQLVPTGDLDALAVAIARAVDAASSERRSRRDAHIPTSAGSMTRSEWQAAVDRHLEGFSKATYEDGVLALLGRALSGAPALGRELETAR
jgi:glycosyltransferase involved in cell wall biosynthesis